MGWWNAAKENENILYLFYEDFIIDPGAYCDKIASFLGVNLSQIAKEKIIEKVTIENMRGNDQTDYLQGRQEDSPGFMRKGIIGDWETHFTLEQNAIFDAWYEENIVKCSDLRFLFKT